MQELIDALEESPNVDYLVDTCFLIDVFEKGIVKEFEKFCADNDVGMSSFNLAELNHLHHKLGGKESHHIRDFLKKKVISRVDVMPVPGNQTSERQYVADFDDELLKIVHDPSDAVLLTLALKIRANVLTKDKHHLFTTAAENYLKEYRIQVLKELP